MRDIQINLVTFEYIDKRFAFISMSLATAIILLLSVTLMRQFFKNGEQLREYEGKLSKMTDSMARKAETSGVGRMEFTQERREQIQQRIRKINQLIAQDIFPWNSLLDSLEHDLPDGLYFETFTPVQGFNRLTMQGRAVAASKVSFLLKQLDNSRFFSNNVLLSLQLAQVEEGKEGVDSVDGLQFTIQSDINLAQLFNEPLYRGIAASLVDKK